MRATSFSAERGSPGSLFYIAVGRRSPGPQRPVSIEPRIAAGARATKTPPATLRLDVNVVLVPVIVTDSLDRPITTKQHRMFRRRRS